MTQSRCARLVDNEALLVCLVDKEALLAALASLVIYILFKPVIRTSSRRS